MNAAPPPRRFFSDGRGIWYIDNIWTIAAALPAQDVPIDQVRELDEACWFNEVWGRKPTCRAVLEHCRRIIDADLSYPVILSPKGELLDGVHRVCRALLAGQSSVRAVRLPVMPPPDETISPTDPRYEAEPAKDA